MSSHSSSSLSRKQARTENADALMQALKQASQDTEANDSTDKIAVAMSSQPSPSTGLTGALKLIPHRTTTCTPSVHLSFREPIGPRSTRSC